MMRWPIKPLGELCDVEGGNSAPQGDEHFKDGTIPFVRMKDLGRPHFTNNLTETDDKLTEASVTTNRMKFFEPGCILFPRSGSVALNHRAILGVRACIVSHIGVLQNLRPEITAGYLYLYLTTFDMTALSKKTTGVDSIAFADVKKIPVPVPSLKEQERIVKLLDEADELRKLRAQADRRTAALIHALFHEIFGDSLNNSTGLEIKELRSVCIIGDGNHSSNYPKASEMLSSGIPFIRAVNLQDGKLDVADMRYISQEKHLKLKKGHLKSGDVLFSNRGEIGKLAIVPDEFDNSNLNSQLAWLRPGEAILSQYLFSLLSSAGYQAGFRRSQQGAALQQFTIKQLSAIKVPIPPMPLQQEFAQRVSEIRELETAQAASRQRVEHLFQSMQHRAFNQEL